MQRARVGYFLAVDFRSKKASTPLGIGKVHSYAVSTWVDQLTSPTELDATVKAFCKRLRAEFKDHFRLETDARVQDALRTFLFPKHGGFAMVAQRVAHDDQAGCAWIEDSHLEERRTFALQLLDVRQLQLATIVVHVQLYMVVSWFCVCACMCVHSLRGLPYTGCSLLAVLCS